MGTGELVRDFHKDDRELRYANSGSIRFTEKEHNAYRLSLTLEVTHVDAPRYGSKKTMPDNTHYGYCTLFKGSTVADTIAIKYPKFRVLDILNQGIWNYHQSTETIQLLSALSQRVSEGVAAQVVNAIVPDTPASICAVLRFLDTALGSQENPWVMRLLGCGESDPEATQDVADRYRGFPIGSPFPDVVKFKSDIPCSFLWRLELWYLVEPSIYAEDSPTDTGDQTEGESEYPEPDQGDGDGDGDEFPGSDDPDPDSDPRDSDGDDSLPGTANNPIVGAFQYEFESNNKTRVAQGLPYAKSGLRSAELGYPGTIVVSTTAGTGQAFYRWKGGSLFLTQTNDPPVSIRGFKIYDGDEVVFSI